MTIAVYCDIKQETKQKQQPKTGGGGGKGGSSEPPEPPLDTPWNSLWIQNGEKKNIGN